MDSKIQFFAEDVSFSLKKKGEIRSWLVGVIREEKKKPWYINFIFCSDPYLLELNRNYLGRETLTDIITFPYSEDPETISGDIYISIDRVKENALKFDQTFEMEMNRVMVHGILHLIGYDDNTKKDRKLMSEMEDHYLLGLTK